MRRDCLKCTVLCYSFGSRECGHSARHCMEFKIAMDKMVGYNFNTNILTLPGFCCAVGLHVFHHFWVVLRCLSQISIEEVKTGAILKGGFTEIWIRCSIFSCNAKGSLFVPFFGRLGELILLSTPTQMIFFASLQYCSFQLSSAPCDLPFNYGTAPA